MPNEPVTVLKLDHDGRETLRYHGRVLERGPRHIRLEALFDRDDVDAGYVVFRRGDRFIETFYTDRWYNVFAIYDPDGGGLKGWYCNICRPAVISQTAVSCDDLALDVWVSTEGETLVLDQDDFDALPIDDEERCAAERALATLLAEAKSGRLPR